MKNFVQQTEARHHNTTHLNNEFQCILILTIRLPTRWSLSSDINASIQMFHHWHKLRVLELHLGSLRKPLRIRIAFEANQPLEFIQVELNVVKVTEKMVVFTSSSNIQQQFSGLSPYKRSVSVLQHLTQQLFPILKNDQHEINSQQPKNIQCYVRLVWNYSQHQILPPG